MHLTSHDWKSLHSHAKENVTNKRSTTVMSNRKRKNRKRKKTMTVKRNNPLNDFQNKTNDPYISLHILIYLIPTEI